jgi:HEPN domain-containing protein
MKQSEKLDLILKELYKHKHDGKFHSISEICNYLKMSVIENEEIFSLAQRLKNDCYINLQFSHDDAFASLTSYGIEYCEEDSYTYKGHSIITNNYINVTNSPNANVVSNSSNVTITITNYGEIKNKITEIKEAVGKLTDETIKQEVLDCIEEIETNIEAGRKPKFAFASLINIAGSLSGVGLLIIELGKLIFGG